MAKGDVYKIFGYRVVNATSDGTTDIAEGDLVEFVNGKVKKNTTSGPTTKVGVAKEAVASGSTSQIPVLVEGVVEVSKATGAAITAGTYVYANAGNAAAVAADIDPRKIIGYAEADAAANDTTVVIRLR